MTTEAQEIIEKLQLEPHDEGGYFREIYRSEEFIKNSCLPDRYSGERCFATAIYYLLNSGQFSYFHKLKSDEVWHFYSGSPLILHCLNELEDYKKIIMGNDVLIEENPQYIIKNGTWLAAEVMYSNSYSLVGCTVSPGFNYNDFCLAKKIELNQNFPYHKGLIDRLTK